MTLKRKPIKRKPYRYSPDETRKAPLKRRKPLPFRSAKRAAIADERRAFVERILTERPRCEGPAHLRRIVGSLDDRDQRVVVDQLRACGPHGRSTEVNEIVKRSRGGSIVEDANVHALCHGCHAWTEAEPRLATLAGMLKSRWQV